MYDSDGSAFLTPRTSAPRLSAVYDPFSDGRSKLSFSLRPLLRGGPAGRRRPLLRRRELRPAVRPAGSRTSHPHQRPATPERCNWTGAGETPRRAAGRGPSPTFNSDYAADEPPGPVPQRDRRHRRARDHRGPDACASTTSTAGWATSSRTATAADENGVLANPGNVPQSAINAARSARRGDQAQATAAWR